MVARLKCEHCDADIDNLHNMYKNIELCEECYGENADALWEDWLMTREACRWYVQNANQWW